MKNLSLFSYLLKALLVFAISCPIWVVSHAQAGSANTYDFADLVEKASPAVVNIRTTQRVQMQNDMGGDDMSEFFRRFFGVPMPGFPAPMQPRNRRPPQQPPVEEEQKRGVGSGFIISADGYIMTSAHVIDGADAIYVTLADKREFKAKVIGSDKRSDVALVKIDGTNLVPLPLGDSDKIRVGERVLAIGSPFELDNTVTAGIVSAKSRDTGEYLPFIQTDVAVNPGNSGGPLINMRGEAIGINSQIISRSGGYMGISFAIPIDEAMRVVKQLKTTGYVTRGRIGIVIGEVTKEVADSLGLGKVRGTLVRNVEPGSPAEKAGIEPGDIVLRFNGRDINSFKDLPRITGETKPGTAANLTIWRKGSQRTVNLTVAEAEDSKAAARARRSPDNTPRASDQHEQATSSILGLAVADIPEERQRDLKLKGGVEIENVDGPAARAGLQPGDLILRMGDTDITSAKQFERVAKTIDKNKMVALFVRRGEVTQIIAIRPNR